MNDECGMMNDAVARAFPLAEDAGEDACVTTQVVVIKDTLGENIRAKISLKMAQMRPVARNITVKPVVPRTYLRAKNARRKICAGLNGRLRSRAKH